MRVYATLDMKMKIIEAYENSEPARSVGERFGISKTQVLNIIKNKEDVRMLWDSGIPRQRKLINDRQTLHAPVNNELFKWLLDMKMKKIHITRSALRQKARDIAWKREQPDFVASNGWLFKFQRRYGIVARKGKLDYERLRCPKEDGEIETSQSSAPVDNSKSKHEAHSDSALVEPKVESDASCSRKRSRKSQPHKLDQDRISPDNCLQFKLSEDHQSNTEDATDEPKYSLKYHVHDSSLSNCAAISLDYNPTPHPSYSSHPICIDDTDSVDDSREAQSEIEQKPKPSPQVTQSTIVPISSPIVHPFSLMTSQTAPMDSKSWELLEAISNTATSIMSPSLPLLPSMPAPLPMASLNGSDFSSVLPQQPFLLPQSSFTLPNPTCQTMVPPFHKFPSLTGIEPAVQPMMASIPPYLACPTTILPGQVHHLILGRDGRTPPSVINMVYLGGNYWSPVS